MRKPMVFLALMAALALPPLAMAQTPASSGAVACTASEASADEVVSWYSAAGNATPAVRPESLPAGDSLDDEMSGTLLDLWDQFLACQAAGNELAVGSLVSPELFVSLYPNLTIAEVALVETEGKPLPEWTLEDIKMVDEQTAVAHLDMGDTAAPELAETNSVWFTRTAEGNWLIDRIYATGG